MSKGTLRPFGCSYFRLTALQSLGSFIVTNDELCTLATINMALRKLVLELQWDWTP